MTATFDVQLALDGRPGAGPGMMLGSALSNQLGHLMLVGGNKSELATGFATLYGDTAGGFAPLKDVPKTLVWELARWRNARARGPRALTTALCRP